MPIYEFRCDKCEGVFEELCRHDEDGRGMECPDCRHVGAKRLISAFAAHGLENGHIAVGRKLTGKDQSAAGTSDPASPPAPVPASTPAPAPAPAPAAGGG